MHSIPSLPGRPGRRSTAATVRRIAWMLLSLGFLGLYPTAGGASPGVLPATLTVWLGPAETVLGPDQRTDNPFHTLGTLPSLMAYVANGNTSGFTTSDLTDLTPLPAAVLVSGGANTFDSCGAWLNSTAVDNGLIRGWYHAETDCDYSGAGHPTRKSVAYVESYDGGHTFQKVGYPANQVITAPPRYQLPNDGSEGDQRVIRVGDYYYMYFLAVRDYQVHLARSRVVDGGRPGTWYKYYNGAFTEPGIGGESSAIAAGLLTTSWVSYLPGLQAFIGISSDPDGYSLALSSNGITNWQRVTPLVVLNKGPYWDRTPASPELLVYPSLIGLDGDSTNLDTDFWLYYMQLKPGENFSNGRYLVRRQVHLSLPATTGAFDTLPRIALTRYQDTTSPDTWVTTTNPDPSYQFRETLGYLYTIPPEPAALPLYDCYLSQEADHMIDIASDCHASGDPTVRSLRQLGWISTGAFPGARRVYRCFDAGPFNHFVSTDPLCEGKQTEWPIGYLAGLPFRDVTTSDTFYTYILRLYFHGMVDGYSDNTFQAGTAATRGTLARWIVRAQGWPIDLTGAPHFTDVPTADPLYLYVETAYNHGVFTGYADHTFRPTNPVTRGQMSKMVVNAMGWPFDTSPGQVFRDVDPSNPFWNQIETIYAHGLVSGYDCGPGCREFRWNNTNTRGQLTKVLSNAIDP